MDHWGPYLPEVATELGFEEFCNRDGIFGFCNSGGTAGAAISAWAGGGGRPKARLQPNSLAGPGGGCEFAPGLADPMYRYCAGRCRCDSASGRPFDIRFELAKESASRIYCRLTVEPQDTAEPASADEESASTAELTVAAQLWVCHADCGRVQLAEEGEASGGGYVRLRMADGCRGQACVHLSDRHESEKTDLPGEDSRRVDNLKLHYSSEHLESVVFCAEPQALDRLIVHGDSSLLCSDQTVGCRVALIYRLPLAPTGSQSLSFLLSPASSPGPDSPAWVSQLMSQAAALASDSLTRPADCGADGRLALAELRHQFDRMSAGGEILAGGGGGVMEPPVWPLALLEFLRHNSEQEAANATFCDLLRHLHWWLLIRRDAGQRSTLDGGILGLRHAGWMDATEHDGETNDSLVWSGFFCAKMVHLAALLRRQELKSLLDLFNAAMASLHNESAFVNGLFRPNLLSDRQPAGEAADATATALPTGASPPCKRGATCCCAFGLVPLLGCAIVPRDGLAADPEANTLVDWLHWLASQASASGSSETPCLFVRGEESRGRMLISWLGEAEFLQTCEVLFDPAHFLGPHGLRCTSLLLSREARDCDNAKDAPCRPVGRASIVSLPWNYLVLEALKCWEAAYGQQLQLDYPTGSGMRHCLNDIIDALMLREYYEATSGRGVGGQRTGWSGVIANIAENLSRQPTLAVLTKPELPRTVGQILPRNSVVHGFRESLRSSIKLDEFTPELSFDWDNDEDED
uniref:Anaphase-promoting complex subunit 1 n=1 Tax=Macrostomum lignano TaxID=282301 RepID=A0A1I8HQ96_9PLAT